MIGADDKGDTKVSWDVLMIRTKTNAETIDSIESENIIPFTQTEVAGALKSIADDMGASYNCDDLSWQILICGSWSIEFNFGGAENPETIMLHVRGSEPKEVFRALTNQLNVRFFDGDSGELIISDKPSEGFENWKNFRDNVINKD